MLKTPSTRNARKCFRGDVTEKECLNANSRYKGEPNACEYVRTCKDDDRTVLLTAVLRTVKTECSASNPLDNRSSWS
jgi:hypothetical protein